MRHYITRKIKNGKVKVFGRYYVPIEYTILKYNGELEGQTFKFYVYETAGKPSGLLYMIFENWKDINWQFWEVI